MALLLSIDTATTVCSVALADKQKIIAHIDSSEEKVHASHLGVFVNEILQKAGKSVKQLDGIAISKGPGSFTGLRIGVSLAKGLCYGADIPLIAVDTLQAMAFGMMITCKDQNFQHNASENILYCPMIDARRMEVYTALYDSHNQPVENVSAKIIDQNSFRSYFNKNLLVLAGDGTTKCKELITNKNAFFLQGFSHSAIYMNELAQNSLLEGKFENIAYFEPYYLKDFIVTIPKRKVI